MRRRDCPGRRPRGARTCCRARRVLLWSCCAAGQDGVRPRACRGAAIGGLRAPAAGSSVDRMRIAVLGPLEVWSDDGRPVAVPGAKERLLLALLAAAAAGRRQHRPDRRDAVEREPPGERAQVAAGASRAPAQRPRARPPPRRGGRLRRPPGHRLRADDGRRRRRCPAGRRAGRARARPARLRASRRRPSGCSRPRSVCGAGSRTATGRTRRSPTRSGAGWPRCAPARVTALLEARLALGEDAEVVAEAERLLTDDPLKEEWWRLLVLALYRCGRQGDALAAVARARRGARRATRRRARPTAPRRRGGGARPGSRRWTCLVPAAPRTSRSARTRAWPPTRRPTPRCSTAASRARHPARRAAGRRAAARRVRRERRRQVLAGPGRPGPGARGRRAAGQRALARRRRHAGTTAAGRAGGTARRPGRRTRRCCWSATSSRSSGHRERRCRADRVPRRAARPPRRPGSSCGASSVVRGDHVGRLAEHAAFAERLGSALVLVPPLTDAELREVVREAGRGGRPDRGSRARRRRRVRRRRTARSPAAALDRPRRHVGTAAGGRLTLAGYLEAGGVAGALDPLGRGRLHAALDEEGQESGAPAARAAGRHRRRRRARPPAAALAELDLDDDAGSPDGGRRLRRPAAARRWTATGSTSPTRRC